MNMKEILEWPVLFLLSFELHVGRFAVLSLPIARFPLPCYLCAAVGE